MANAFTQIHIQLVFAVKYREALINNSWQEELHRYVTGIVQKSNHKMIQVNSMADHIHAFIGMRPHEGISSLVQDLKADSTKWIKSKNFCKGSFAWQDGYGAFSYSKSHVNSVIRYIQNQKTHHKKETFLEEYSRLLKLFDIEYDKKYIFKNPI